MNKTKKHLNKEAIKKELCRVEDPEWGLNIVDLGFVRDVEIDNQQVNIKLTLSCPGCPMGRLIIDNIVDKVKTIPEVAKVNVDLVFNPPWSPRMMSEKAKKQLKIE